MTTRNLAEFKARKLGDLCMANGIRENLVTDAKIKKYLDHESVAIGEQNADGSSLTDQKEKDTN